MNLNCSYELFSGSAVSVCTVAMYMYLCSPHPIHACASPLPQAKLRLHFVVAAAAECKLKVDNSSELCRRTKLLVDNAECKMFRPRIDIYIHNPHSYMHQYITLVGTHHWNTLQQF